MRARTLSILARTSTKASARAFSFSALDRARATINAGSDKVVFLKTANSALRFEDQEFRKFGKRVVISMLTTRTQPKRREIVFPGGGINFWLQI